MIHALEAVGVAWLMINVALFVAMKREDAMDLSRRTIDRFLRAIGVLSSLATTGTADRPPLATQRRGLWETRRAEAPEKGWIFKANPADAPTS
jgi:hypothetical protein